MTSRKPRTKGLEKAKKFALTQAESMMNVLLQVAVSSTDDRARVAAATAILDRAFGLPVAKHQLSGPVGAPIAFVNPRDLSGEELAKLAQLYAAEAADTDNDGS